MRNSYRCFVLVVWLVLGLVSSSEARQRSPFSALRFPDTAYVEVEVEDVWYRLVSIDDCQASELIEHSKAAHRSKWKKRIGEDLGQLFEELGRSLGDTAKLKLQPFDGGDELTLDDVRVTKANRQRILMANRGDAPMRPLDPSAELAPEVWHADLESLAEVLESRFAYLGLREVTPSEEIEQLKKKHGKAQLTRSEFAREVGVLLAKFGDGHAGVGEAREFLAEGYAPFLLRDAEEGVVAFRPDRSGFIAPKHPYLEAIDGVALDDWLKVAARHVSAGSPQLVKRRALERLRWIQDVRRDAGFPEQDEIVLTLKDASGRTTQEIVEVSARRPIFGDWPQRGTGWLTGEKLGYLRLGKMDSGLEQQLGDALTKFSEAEALVIDVRGNGGGVRDALRFLAPRFLGPKNDPVVTNVGRYALPPDEREDSTEGHLSDRYLWPRDASTAGWSKEAKRAIDRFAKKFKPMGALTSNLSEPHYLVIDHPPEGTPRFEGLVLVLQNGGCFSATDIFLAGMKELPGVITAGTSSSGGSARSRRYQLRGSGLSFKCASMASWQVGGEFFDGHGVMPDVELKPRATDFLVGEGDSVLERALELVGAKSSKKELRQRK